MLFLLLFPFPPLRVAVGATAASRRTPRRRQRRRGRRRRRRRRAAAAAAAVAFAAAASSPLAPRLLSLLLLLRFTVPFGGFGRYTTLGGTSAPPPAGTIPGAPLTFPRRTRASRARSTAPPPAAASGSRCRPCCCSARTPEHRRRAAHEIDQHARAKLHLAGGHGRQDRGRRIRRTPSRAAARRRSGSKEAERARRVKRLRGRPDRFRIEQVSALGHGHDGRRRPGHEHVWSGSHGR